MLSIGSNVTSRRFPLLLSRLSRVLKEGNKRCHSQRVLQFQHSIDERFTNIDSFARRTGRVTRKDVDDIFKDLLSASRLNIPATSSQSLLLIRCCGSLLSEEPPLTRNSLVQEIFTVLSDSTKLDISHYNALLQVYLDNEFNFNPLDILSEIQGKGIEPNRVTYQRLIHRYCQSGDIDGATKILEFMKTKELPINESVFNSLILGYGKCKDLESAYGTLNIMKKSGVDVSSDTYTALLCAFAANADNDNALKRIPELIEEAKRNEIALTDRDYMDIIKTLAIADNKCPLIDELINNIPKAIGYNQECMKIVTELIHNDRIDVALKLYATMKPSQVQIEQKTVGLVLIRNLVRAKVSPEIVLNLCEDLKSKGLNDYGLSKATETALLIGDINSARIYLNKFSREVPLRVHYFWPILARCSDDMSVFQILSEDMVSMANSEYGALHETFVDYVWPKVKLDIDLFMEKCKAIGYSFTLTLNSLIDYLLHEKRIDDAAFWVTNNKYSASRLQTRILIHSLAEAYCDNPDVENTVKILLEFARNSDRNASFGANAQSSEVIDWTGRFLVNIIGLRPNDKSKLLTPLLDVLCTSGIRISTKSAFAIREKCPTLTPQENDLLKKLESDKLEDAFLIDIEEFTKPRREMTIQELEENLIELRSKGLNTRGVLRSLLFAYCRNTRMSTESENVVTAQTRVKEIMEQLKNEQMEFTNAMFSALIEFNVHCGHLDNAIDAYDKITDDFEIDPHKIFNFASLFVKNDRINDAVDLIKKEITRNAKRVNDSVEPDDDSLTKQYRNCDRSINKFLNAIIDQTKDAKLVKELFQLSLDYSGIKVTTLMAGPLIKVHLANDDHESALNEYVNCVTSYRVAPWKTELMRSFLTKSDSSSLQTIIDHSNTIHGEMSTIVDLAIACIDVGKLKQAKKLLETPGLRVKHEKIEIICDKFISDAKINELEYFVQNTKNLFDIDRDLTYYNLIRGYAKANDGKKALNVWTLMQEENIQPSDRTLRLLSNVLKEHGIAVPFVAPPVLAPIAKEPLSRNQPLDDSSEKGSFNQLNVVIKRGDIDAALEMKHALESKGDTILLSQNCAIIELLLNADRLKEASNLTQTLLQSGRYPNPRILRFLLNKLSGAGHLEIIESIKDKLPNSVVQTAWYTSIIASAYVNAGKADHFIDNVLPNIKPFPLGGLLALLSSRSDLETKILSIANQLANETDYHLPQNMIWIHYMQNERYDDAKRLFDSNPKFKEFLLFTALMDKIRETKNPIMARKLIDTLMGSNLTPKSIGIAYGCLIDVLIELKKIDDAENIVVNELINNTKVRIDAHTGEEQKIIDIEHVSRGALFRLINAIREVKQREPNFSLPQKPSVSSESAHDSGSSSDDEEIGIKQK